MAGTKAPSASVSRRGASVRTALLVFCALAGLSQAAHADGRDTIIDFGDASRSGATYLQGSAAGSQPGPVARTPVPTAPTVAPAQAYSPAPAAASSSARPAQAPAPIAVPASQYDVSPTPTNGYTVAPTSIEDYSKPGALSAEPRRYYAELYAPQPLPQRLGGNAAATPAPAPGLQYPAAAAAAPRAAVSTKYGRQHPQAKAARAPKKDEDGDKDDDKRDEAADDKNGEEKPENPPHLAIDVSVGGTTRKSTTISTGATAALGGHLEESGFRGHVAGQGQFACCVGNFKSTAPTQGTALTNTVLVGYEAVGEKGTVAGYVGMNIENQPIAATEDTPATRKTYTGFQVAADIYYTPTDKIMMSSNMSFSSRKYSYFMRSKLGFAVAEDLYVGPEIGASGSKEYQQYRVGAHLSGLKLGQLTFGLAGGYALDRKNGNGAYAILDSRVTF